MHKWSPDQKFLLCRPRGGLNDTLCQIERCVRYAATFDRILIIDTRNSELQSNFSDYFEPKHKSSDIIFDADAHILEYLNGLICFPAEARGRANDLNLRDTTTVPLTFDFDKDYSEPLLLHERWGGGRMSFELIDRLRLSQEIRPIVLDRLSDLKGRYHAVHVRNTDLKTDYKAFFERISPEVSGKRLLVCSDDCSVIEYAREYFKSSEILTSSKIPDTKGEALHQFGDRRERTIETLVDLIALGRAERLFFSTVHKGYISGFSQLANHLAKNKHVIDDLFGTPRLDISHLRLRIYLSGRRTKDRLRRFYYRTVRQWFADYQSRSEFQ